MYLLKHIPVDDYIAKCYHVYDFKKTYEHYLQPMEGMPAWPISNRPRPVTPGHIAMPHRKKKSRTKERKRSQGAAELVELELPLDVGNEAQKLVQRGRQVHSQHHLMQRLEKQ
jgi:hypothetical protein